jgi:hypothetical protein
MESTGDGVKDTQILADFGRTSFAAASDNILKEYKNYELEQFLIPLAIDTLGGAFKIVAGARNGKAAGNAGGAVEEGSEATESGAAAGKVVSNEAPSARNVHDQFVQQVRPGAKEVVFETPWSEGKGLGSRKFDDFDPKTGTAFEGNTTPWSRMTQEQLSRKLDQAGSDFTLLKTSPDIKRIIWFGTEELPKTGLGGQLREALQNAGIPYWVVKP